MLYTNIDTGLLVLGTGIARGQYYWILGALLGIIHHHHHHHHQGAERSAVASRRCDLSPK